MNAALLVVAVLFGAALTGAALGFRSLPRRRPYGKAPDGDGPFLFPAGFLWGAATSDQQIEHQQPSDWTDLENRAASAHMNATSPTGAPLPGHIKGIVDVRPDVLRKKADFDRLYAEDLGRAASMGHNAHRFSMSWARLYPREDQRFPDPAGIDFYGRILDEHKRAGLVPFVTLHHFAIPAWLARESGGRRGVERADAVAHFQRFADEMARTFGDRVHFWCTINEPMVYAYQGYLDGTFPPNEQREGPKAVTPVRDALLMMHAAAYRAIHDDAKRRRSNASVGFAQHVRAFMPWRDLNPLDRFTANAIDKMFITDFIDGARGLMDYVGVNFYGRSYVKTKLTDPTHFEILHHDQNDPNEDQSDLGWAADEEALTDTLARFHERYGLPQYVLENGTADSAIDDARRQRGLVRHTQAIWRAVQHHHADVRGYFHWSLIDNFEWAEGFGPRFGLYAVDYERDFARTPRKSVDVYKQIASHNALPAALWRRFRR